MSRSLAWEGDRTNDFYLSLIGTQDKYQLAPRQLDGIRQKLFSEKGLSGGLGRVI